MRHLTLLLCFAAAAGAARARAEGPLVGGEFEYAARPGDSLTLIGARFGVSVPTLATANGLRRGDRLSVGQRLRIDNRHVVPFFLDDGILINVPQRLLFLFRGGRLAAWYPVGLGRRHWRTTLGRFEIRSRERNPTWDVPVSIQAEMERRGEEVRTSVPPGPDNPLGDYWLGMTATACGIHGTNAPASIYHFRTHGCIRLHPDDIADLFGRVSVGTPVWVVDEPILLAQEADGSVFLEVNPGAFASPLSPADRVEALAARQGLAGTLDAAAVAGVVALREGLARRVDRSRQGGR